MLAVTSTGSLTKLDGTSSHIHEMQCNKGEKKDRTEKGVGMGSRYKVPCGHQTTSTAFVRGRARFDSLCQAGPWFQATLIETGLCSSKFSVSTGYRTWQSTGIAIS